MKRVIDGFREMAAYAKPAGVTVLIELLEKTQGLDLFTDLLVRLSTTESVTAVVAFVTGVFGIFLVVVALAVLAGIATIAAAKARVLGVECRVVGLLRARSRAARCASTSAHLNRR